MKNSELLSLTEVAKMTPYSKRTLYRNKNTEKFPVRPVPGFKPFRYRESDIKAWLKGEYTG